MSEPRQTQDTPVGRWRERRRAKRQQRLERRFYAERASRPAQDGIYHSSAYTQNAPVAFWAGFGGGGDGGGGGCDGGGGC